MFSRNVFTQTLKRITAPKINNKPNFSLFKLNLHKFSSMMINTNSHNCIPMPHFDILENNKISLCVEMDNLNNSLLFFNNDNNIEIPKENIVAEFMNKRSKLAKRKRSKRRFGKKTSLRYR